MYNIYINAKKENKSEKETYVELKNILCNVSVSIITEEKYRLRRHK